MMDFWFIFNQQIIRSPFINNKDSRKQPYDSIFHTWTKMVRFVVFAQCFLLFFIFFQKVDWFSKCHSLWHLEERLTNADAHTRSPRIENWFENLTKESWFCISSGHSSVFSYAQVSLHLLLSYRGDLNVDFGTDLTTFPNTKSPVLQCPVEAITTGCPAGSGSWEMALGPAHLSQSAPLFSWRIHHLRFGPESLPRPGNFQPGRETELGQDVRVCS